MQWGYIATNPSVVRNSQIYFLISFNLIFSINVQANMLVPYTGDNEAVWTYNAFDAAGSINMLSTSSFYMDIVATVRTHYYIAFGK